MSVKHHHIYAFNVQPTNQQSNMLDNQHCIYTFRFMSFNHHHIYTFSFQSPNKPFNIAMCQPTIIDSKKSALCQSVNHHCIYTIQFSVNEQTIQQSNVSVNHHCNYMFSYMSVNHHVIYTSSFQSTNKPVNKAKCQLVITAYIKSALCQSTNIASITFDFDNKIFNKEICQSTITASIFSFQSSGTSFNKPTSYSSIITSIPKHYVSQPPLHIYFQFSVNQQSIRQSNMSVSHHCNYTFSFMSVNQHTIYTFSFQSTNKPSNKAMMPIYTFSSQTTDKPLLKQSIHSVLSQQNQNQQNNMSVTHHCIYTFSFQSANNPFDKAICQSTINIYILSVVALDEPNISGCLHF